MKPLPFLAVVTAAAALQVQVPLQPQAHLHDTSSASSGDKPLVESSSLQDTIKGKNLLSRAKELYSIAKKSEDEFGHPTRVIGSVGHVATISHILTTLSDLGGYYELSRQPFPAVSGSVYESRLVIGHAVPLSASPMRLTPPTKHKQPVYGKVILVEHQGCDASDFQDVVAGSIVFIPRGTCSFSQKSQLAGLAGAVAAVIFNTQEGSLYGTLGVPSLNHVATFGLSLEDAVPVLQEIEARKSVDAIAYVDADVSIIRTNNIIAQTVSGDPDNCVMLGGHSDSVSSGPGINDDGSGSMALLEIAVQLANFAVNNCVRFAWWSGEEEGLLGSDYYVSVLPPEENLKIRLFMDYDMLASPNFAYQIYNATNAENPVGSEELRELYVSWYRDQKLNYTFVPFDGRSDYDGFIRNGIPAGGIATGAEGIKTKEEEEMFGGKAGEWYDPCYHQLCDDVGNVNVTAWEFNTKLVAHSVATFARSFKGFPQRTFAPTVHSAAYQPQYHGRHLIM